MHAKWRSVVVGIAVVVLLVGVASAGAAPRGPGGDVHKLAVENRIAEQLMGLNLTEGQLQELKSALESAREAQSAHAEQVKALLEARLDAVLRSDRESIADLNSRLAELHRERARDVQDAFSGFREGLTERQKVVLGGMLGPQPGRQLRIMSHPARPAERIEAHRQGEIPAMRERMQEVLRQIPAPMRRELERRQGEGVGRPSATAGLHHPLHGERIELLLGLIERMSSAR